MALETTSNQLGVQDFFANPIKNQSAVKSLLGGEFSDSPSPPAGEGRGEGYKTSYDSNLNKYLNEKAISEMINVNTEISRILDKFKISIKINMSILNNLVQNHLPQTKNTALGIADNLPQNFKPAVNRKALVEATVLHDIAKVIIPENIVNKQGSLTEAEREIMKEHAKLSYELLKTTDLSEETLNLIKNHHQNPQKTGYPIVDEDFAADLNLQILSMADIYSALREKRSYKAELNREQALEIINKETQEGKFHPQVYKALVDYTNKEESSFKLKPKRQIFNFKSVNSFST